MDVHRTGRTVLSGQRILMANLDMSEFLLWKQQATNDGYMTTLPNSLPGSTNKLAINQVRIH